MKKKILSQLMILSFAFAGLFLVGNNVFADQGNIEHLKPLGRYCTWGIQNVGGSSVAVYCHDCMLRIGSQGIGSSGQCF